MLLAIDNKNIIHITLKCETPKKRLPSSDGLGEGENRKKLLRTEQQTCYHDSGVSVTPPPPRDVTITTRVMQRTNKKRPILTLAGVRRRQLTRREKILYKVEVVEDFSLSHFQKKP
jgi:hypothetical protein